MPREVAPDRAPRTYVISLENRKARGSGHERPDEILAAARELFLEHGVEHVSTRQIAAKVGVSQTALYVYFKNKEQMLERLTDAAFQKLDAALGRVDAQHPDPVAYLQAALPEYVRFGLNHPEEYRLAFLLGSVRHLPSASPPHSTVGLGVFGVLQARVADGIASGRLRGTKDSAQGRAQAIWAAVHGLVALLLARPNFDWIATDQLIAMHTDMLMQGLVADGPATAAPKRRRSRVRGQGVTGST